MTKPFIHSLHLQLREDPLAPSEPIELGIRAGRHTVAECLLKLEAAGVSHVLLHLGRTRRPVREVVDELGLGVLPCVRANGPVEILTVAARPAQS